MTSGRRRVLMAVLFTSAFWIVLILILLQRSAILAAAEPGETGAAGAAITQSDATLRMAQRLQKFADRTDLETNVYANAERVERLRTLTPPAEPAERLRFDLRFALELLNAGLTAEAVSQFEDLSRRVERVPEWRDSSFGKTTHSLLAVAHLRQGEQENCIRHHGTDSCLLPIRGGGVHTEQRGSRAAIEELTEALTGDPGDLRSRWLLNVAYMTVGEYPAQVPAAWLIPPSAFESDYDIGRFHDVTAEVGLDVVGLAGGAIMEDFDGDGYLDVMVTSLGLRDQMRFLHNERDGTFADRTDEAGLTGIVSGLNAVHADYDNDGDMDVYVPRGAWLHEDGRQPHSLLRNRGDATFDDVTEVAGLVRFDPSQTAAWGDYDNDGWVDLLVGAESVRGEPPHFVGLYHNNGDGTFSDVARTSGVDVLGYFKGAIWGDYDNDGLLDIYLTALEPEPSNILFHNDGGDGRGGWRFTDVTDRAGVRGPAASFPTWFFDYDNDGWLDIFVSGYAGTVADVAADYLEIGKRGEGKTPRLYRNRGDGTFEDVAHEARVDTVLMTMGCNFGDLDNDGWLDFYAATGSPDYRSLVPNRMFRNVGGRYFQDVTTSGGFGHLQKGHGVAFGDIDNDGDQDVFLKVGGAFSGDTFQSALFENPGHGNHWITLKLVGVHSNRAAIGARIKVTIDELGASREIHATVTSGSSFGGSSLQQEIGLGQASRIRSIEITWPATGRRQVFDDVAMDRFVEIREGDPRPLPIPLEQVDLGRR